MHVQALNMQHQPCSLPNLAGALASGRLPPLDKARIRASLAIYDGTVPATVRHGLMLILQRVRDYLSCVDYAKPDRIVGRADRELPSAKSCEYSRRENGAWYLSQLKALSDWPAAGGGCCFGMKHPG